MGFLRRWLHQFLEGFIEGLACVRAEQEVVIEAEVALAMAASCCEEGTEPTNPSQAILDQLFEEGYLESAVDDGTWTMQVCVTHGCPWTTAGCSFIIAETLGQYGGA